MASPLVESLFYYPVKGLAGVAVDAWVPESVGFRFDRRWMFVTPAGRFISQRGFPELVHWTVLVAGDDLVFSDRRRPDEYYWVPDVFRTDRSLADVTVWEDRLQAYHIDAPVVRQLTAAMGMPDAQLVYLSEDLRRPLDPKYAQGDEHTHLGDAFPYLIVNTASLAALSEHCGESLDVSRFRPNIVVKTDRAWAEDEWAGIRVGPHRFRIDKACARCRVITIDQRTGEQRLELLERLADLRKVENRVLFGVYAVWESNADKQPLRAGDTVEIELRPDTVEAG